MTTEVGKYETALLAIADRLGELVELQKQGAGMVPAAIGLNRTAIQAHDTELAQIRATQERLEKRVVAGLNIEAVEDRIEANEQAVQSCISTMGEMQKLMQRLAENQAGGV